MQNKQDKETDKGKMAANLEKKTYDNSSHTRTHTGAARQTQRERRQCWQQRGASPLML